MGDRDDRAAQRRAARDANEEQPPPVPDPDDDDDDVRSEVSEGAVSDLDPNDAWVPMGGVFTRHMPKHALRLPTFEGKPNDGFRVKFFMDKLDAFFSVYGIRADA